MFFLHSLNIYYSWNYRQENAFYFLLLCFCSVYMCDYFEWQFSAKTWKPFKWTRLIFFHQSMSYWKIGFVQGVEGREWHFLLVNTVLSNVLLSYLHSSTLTVAPCPNYISPALCWLAPQKFIPILNLRIWLYLEIRWSCEDTVGKKPREDGGRV